MTTPAHPYPYVQVNHPVVGQFGFRLVLTGENAARGNEPEVIEYLNRMALMIKAALELVP